MEFRMQSKGERKERIFFGSPPFLNVSNKFDGLRTIAAEVNKVSVLVEKNKHHLRHRVALPLH
jgi:hypothetical protein